MTPDNPLVAILQMLVESQKVQSDYMRQKRDGDREQRFKIHRNIPKITADGATGLLDEFDEFETAFTKTNPTGPKDWAMTLDDALEGTAKSWRDYIILTDPGKTLYKATLAPAAKDTDCTLYYRYIRGELFRRAGLDYENPGEETKKRWEGIRIPAQIKHQEDLDEQLEVIIRVYHQMARHGVIIPGHPPDERRLVMDLSTKVGRSTEFRTWFYGTEEWRSIATVRGWIDRAQRHRSLLARRKHERVMEAYEQPGGGIGRKQHGGCYNRRRDGRGHRSLERLDRRAVR